MGESEARGEEDSSVRRRNNRPSNNNLRTIRVAGLDPGAGRSKTGYALAELQAGSWRLVACGETSLYRALQHIAGSTIVGVDAPLHPPYQGYRDVERLAMKKYGARLLPGGLPGMRSLSIVGYSISMLSQEAGMLALETHPYTVYKLLGFKRTRLPASIASRHVVDAIAALTVALCMVEGSVEILVGSQGMLVFPGENCRDKITVMLGLASVTCP